MKKLLIAVLIIFLTCVAAVYVFIPQELKVSSITIIKANERPVYRSFIDENNWKKWWPGNHVNNAQENRNELYLNNDTYKTGSKLPFGIEVIISSKDTSMSSFMRLLPLSPDSMLLNWTATIRMTFNPMVRVKKYFEVKRIEKSMHQIAEQLKRFAEREKNLYGIDIKHTKVSDTIFVVKKIVQKEKPTITELYKNIHGLNNYIAANGAKATNYPMLHLNYNTNLKRYEVMTAIPVNKLLIGNSEIMSKRMVAGNILYAEVKGGEATAAEAMRQMENYVLDHEKTSPALPFQLLITDRTVEKDTANWITRIYYPIL